MSVIDSHYRAAAGKVKRFAVSGRNLPISGYNSRVIMMEGGGDGTGQRLASYAVLALGVAYAGNGYAVVG
jgi:hypothetical protein